MGGQGDLRLSAIASSGATVAPAEVKAHDGSSWKRPGDEWGSLFIFPASRLLAATRRTCE
jgi:hypothetical protein